MRINEKKVKNVTFLTLNNEQGMEVTLCTFGASIYNLKVIDRNHKMESIVLTPSYLEDFYKSTGYYGKCIGRFSGRIDKGNCTIHHQKYELEKNWNGVNALHGGSDGIAFQNFSYQIKDLEKETDIIFTYIEKEGDLPGDVSYCITYQIMKQSNEINLVFDACTTKDTLVNLTNHVYFNLSGDIKRTILDQELQLFCDTYTKLNDDLITEAIEEVSPVMDFRKSHAIQDYIYDDGLQNHKAKGYDHCWMKSDEQKELIAVLYDDISKRKLSVSTSYPAIVCYAGCYPEKLLFQENQISIQPYHSICLECQFIPNGINMDKVDSAILKKGDRYLHNIRYKFEVNEVKQNE